MTPRDALEVVRKGIIGLYDQQAMPDDSAQPKLDEAIAVLSELVERAGEPVAWMPIETAPKDVDVVVFLPGAAVSIRIAMLCQKLSGQEGWVWLDTGCNRLDSFPPTHWQPLPTVPGASHD